MARLGMPISDKICASRWLSTRRAEMRRHWRSGMIANLTRFSPSFNSVCAATDWAAQAIAAESSPTRTQAKERT